MISSSSQCRELGSFMVLPSVLPELLATAVYRLPRSMFVVQQSLVESVSGSQVPYEPISSSAMGVGSDVKYGVSKSSPATDVTTAPAPLSTPEIMPSTCESPSLVADLDRSSQ